MLLAGNDITDVGGKVLAASLETNYTLRILSLSDNPLTDITAAAFARALQVNTSLKELGLNGAYLILSSFRHNVP